MPRSYASQFRAMVVEQVRESFLHSLQSLGCHLPIRRKAYYWGFNGLATRHL